MNKDTGPGLGRSSGFTLIELLVVIAIMGAIAAIALPTINKFKPNVVAAASQQLMTDVSRARQLAIANHTTVFMVFVPPGFWNDPAYNPGSAWPAAILSGAQRLTDKQMLAYNYVSLRSVGDQPGRPVPHYLDSWRTLPEGTFIASQMFRYFNASGAYLNIYTNGSTSVAYSVAPFAVTNMFPFPTENAQPASNGRWVSLPYIAFNYQGELVTLDKNGNQQPVSQNQLIPIAQGSLQVQRDKLKNPVQAPSGSPPVTPYENPPGNTTNAFNLVNLDTLTGRARLERQEVQ